MWDAGGKVLPIIGKVFLCVKAAIALSTEYKKTTRMTRVRTRYSTIFADVTEDMEQRTRNKEDLGGLQRRALAFIWMSIVTFDEHCNYGL